MKKMLFGAVAALFFLSSSLMAQNNENKDLEAHVEASIVSHYMWRGVDMAGVSLQPQLDVSWKGLSLIACGSAGLDKDDLQEIDLTLGYKNWGFNIGVTDYWQTGIDAEDRFFYYNDKKTPHQLEANIGYSCKYGSLQAYTMFWGEDYKANGDRAYSTFIELSVPFRAGGLDWDLRAGVTPMESAGVQYTIIPEGAAEGFGIIKKEYLYGGKFTCNMASIRATKTLEYKNVKIPVFAEFHANPELKTARFLAGVSVVVF